MNYRSIEGLDIVAAGRSGHPANSRWPAACTAGSAVVLAFALAACGSGSETPANTLSPIASPTSTASASVNVPSPVEGEGDLLSTAGQTELQTIRVVSAREGEFAIRPIDGVDTLFVANQPARYQQTGEGTQPVTIEANDGLRLVGVFELPGQSVAWAIIYGGAACAATHLLVPVQNGVVLPGQEIPGCDDRGTMRRVGDRIVFEAGGRTGFFQNGLLTVEQQPDIQ